MKITIAKGAELTTEPRKQSSSEAAPFDTHVIQSTLHTECVTSPLWFLQWILNYEKSQNRFLWHYFIHLPNYLKVKFALGAFLTVLLQKLY